MRTGVRSLRARAVLAAAVIAALAAPAVSSAGTSVQRVAGGHVVLDFTPHHAASSRTAATTTTLSVQRFTRKVTDGTKTFSVTMVGKNPFVALTHPSTTIPTYIVPLKIVLPNSDVFDPTVAGSCDPSTSAVTRTLQSPLVVSQAYTQAGKALGTGQYTDIFRRAEFYSRTSPSALNPGYHVKLNVTTLGTRTVNVPAADAAEFASATGCGEQTGAVEINWLDGYLTSTLLPALRSQGVTEKAFPLFLVRDVVAYDTVTSNCCILGYHSFTTTAAGKQTYGLGDYESSGRFTDSPDVSSLSHEIAEWQDDPFGNNPTKAWGHIGQVTGCQKNLEVGDPLSGTNMNVSSSGHAYHPQELAFFSWFYHSRPSLGVNGLFSNNGTFTTSAAACP